MPELLAWLYHSQMWSPDRIEEYQFSLLRKLLAHARDTVPFYAKRFRQAGVVPKKITPATWTRIPLLTRRHLQSKLIFSKNIPRFHGQIQKKQSSGSTGEPVTVLISGLTNFFWQAFTIRDHQWQQRNLAGKLALIRYDATLEQYPDGVNFANWGPPAANLFKTGPAAMISIRTPLDRQVKWLQEQNPDVLLTYPSNLAALLERCSRLEVKLPRLKEVRTISEILSPELRSRCRQFWQVPVTDMYSSQEVGYMALQCPDHEHYHIQSEGVFVEILDDKGNPCRPGEVGRVVVTALHNYASPLIRYEINDLAEVGHPCPCGRGLPTIKRIVGRQRNMLTLPSGEKCWPLIGSRRYSEVACIRQFQFVQHSLEEMEMRLVSDQPLSEDQQSRLREIIMTAMDHQFNITFTRLPVIERSANGKFEEFISLVSQPPA